MAQIEQEATATTEFAALGGGSVGVAAQQLDELESRIEGRLLRADDGWDDAVLIWNAVVASTPALVVQPLSADDVSIAVRFAATHGVLLPLRPPQPSA